MNHVLRNIYWPYDELTTTGPDANGRVEIRTPWLALETTVAPEHRERAAALFRKMNDGTLAAADLADVSGFLSGFAAYSLAYILPRRAGFHGDMHPAVSFDGDTSPRELLARLIPSADASKVPAAWTWDVEAALAFSRSGDGYDSLVLFSVARRFHLLDSLELNRTDELLTLIQSLRARPDEFRRASALMLRQNHHVTLNCEPGLRRALPLARSAEEKIFEFITAEGGHDELLAASLRELGVAPEAVPVLDSTRDLMNLFGAIAETNFVGFAMMIDMFERSSYREEDPFASALRAGGANRAANQIEHHREINDAGGHENVALGFLANLGPIDVATAKLALRLAELVTHVMHRVSGEIIDRVRADG